VSPAVDRRAHHPPNPLRRLYAWVLYWSASRHGTRALAGIAFAEASVFPIPPDPLQIALSVGRPERSFRYAAVSALASVAGAVAGWAIGAGLWSLAAGVFFVWVPGLSPELFERVRALYVESAFLAIVTAAFTPIPFKVFTLASAGRMTASWGIARSSAWGSTGWWVGPSSPTPILSWVKT